MSRSFTLPEVRRRAFAMGNSMTMRRAGKGGRHDRQMRQPSLPSTRCIQRVDFLAERGWQAVQDPSNLATMWGDSEEGNSSLLIGQAGKAARAP